MKTTTLKSGGSSLGIDERGGLEFLLAGRRRWGTTALCVLHYYDRQHPRAEQVPVPHDQAHALGTAGTLSMSARGVMDVRQLDERTAAVDIAFDAILLRVALRIELAEDGQGFDVTVPADGVREDVAAQFRLLGLEILPAFGAARTGEQGYLTLPNWSGCQTFFDKAYPREVWQTIYSSNDQWENTCNAPVFGITRSQGTLCGLIAAGDEDAQLVCRRHWEAAQANSAHPYLVWRWAQEDDCIPGPRQVRYRFAHPDCAEGEGYAFVAAQYRRFLRAERGVMAWADKGKVRPEAPDFAARFLMKIFMAYKEPHPDGQGAYHCACTCEEARQILEQCQARGMKKLTVALVGWGQDGHDGKCPTYLPVDERVGGAGGMAKLIAWCRERDIQLCVHASYHAAYRCSPEFDERDCIQHRNGEVWRSVIWSGGREHRLCPRVALERYIRRDLSALAGMGLHGHHHFDCIGGFMCCHSPRHPVPRRSDFMEQVREQFRAALATMGSVSTEMPFGQYFGVVDGFWTMYSRPGSHQRACPMGRYFLDRGVPLIELALHGSHACTEGVGPRADDPLARRQMAEFLAHGLRPHVEVCARASATFGIPAYSDRAELMAEAYRLAHGPDGYVTRLGMLDIAGRWEPAPGITRTLYSDGTEVWVNLSEEDFDGIPAGEFRVRGTT
jgi:hypothetical protein